MADWRRQLDELTTAANLISLSRLPLVLLIVLLLDTVWRYPLFALVIVSDGIDGWVARRYDQTTELGALLDPALDKLTALALFFVLFPRTGLAWEYLALFFARDLYVTSMGLLLPFVDLDTGEIKARLLGKVVTNLQFFAMVAMLVPAVMVTEGLLWALGVASVLAIGDYVVFISRELTDGGLAHSRAGAVGSYVGVAVVFSGLVFLLLREELQSFLSTVL